MNEKTEAYLEELGNNDRGISYIWLAKNFSRAHYKDVMELIYILKKLMAIDSRHRAICVEILESMDIEIEPELQ